MSVDAARKVGTVPLALFGTNLRPNMQNTPEVLAFGRKTLSQLLGGETEGEQFVEYLAAWDSGTLTDAQKTDIKTKARRLRGRVGGQGLMSEFWQAHLWRWLERMAHNMIEVHNASFY